MSELTQAISLAVTLTGTTGQELDVAFASFYKGDVR